MKASVGLQKWQIVLGILAAGVTVSAAILPLARSDAPPLAGISRVENSQRDLIQQLAMAKEDVKKEVRDVRADLMYSRAVTNRLNQCDAQKKGDQRAALAFGELVSNAQQVYMQLTGDTIPLPC